MFCNSLPLPHDSLLLAILAAPKGLFPPDPEPYTGPKLKVAIVGGGLAGMSTAVELLEQGHEVSGVVRNVIAQILNGGVAVYV